jgi:alpha-glucosidase (family GH31 glycosyl hydrolase)
MEEGFLCPYVIYNDYYNHEDFITALINSGTAGVLWTPEVRASKTAEEWLRRFQTVIFSPMAMINAWSSGTKPWSYPEVAEQVKELALLRMRMMPYWYSEFAKYHFEGTPPFHGMALEEGFKQELRKDAQIVTWKRTLMQKPLPKRSKTSTWPGNIYWWRLCLQGKQQVKVVLPKGKWYDFYTGELAGDGEVITGTPGLDKIPVYVKDGGIIPMMPAMEHAPEAGQKTDLEIRYYGTKAANYILYDDDGETFNYEKGEYSFREIKVTKNSSRKFRRNHY